MQAACIGSGSAGTGVLFVRGKQYPFDVGGAGVGGIGLSTIDASGEVYNLRELAQFPGTQMSAGELWMQNEAGVILPLEREA